MTRDAVGAGCQRHDCCSHLLFLRDRVICVREIGRTIECGGTNQHIFVLPEESMTLAMSSTLYWVLNIASVKDRTHVI